MMPGDLVRLIDPQTYAGNVIPPGSIGLVVKVEKTRNDYRDVVAEVMWCRNRYHNADPAKLTKFPRYLAEALEVISEAG
jgi:hypothetical protein